MKNIIIFCGALFLTLQAKAQDLNAYKYVIVPQQFSFQKEPNQYKVNQLTKFLFKKYGFDAYLVGETLPLDANANGCNTLNMEAEAGGFLGTNLTYTLANCRGEVVYTSPEGKSKIKQYEGAYNEVMREAMTGLEELGYVYSDEVLPMKDTRQSNVLAKGDTETNNAAKNGINTTEKTVVVSAVPQTSKNPKVSTSQATENKAKITQVQNPKTTQNATKSSENKPKNTVIREIYKSMDGSYILKRTAAGFDFYEGESKIGEARKTSAGSYLVTTTEFVGIGSLNDDIFTVEREIKGVDGLIKMEFKAADQ
ncbi:hypothetical protein [Flavimarina sp. Hel_I_48]|uniref:hypothetical protein n=1 Tax=Flavimarina sp. Hel_I_48 TaxID=1392488 RepID=UPI00068B05A4|nr:hypothetical protein [Flavimarina sp. Hel_I_48]